MVPCKHWGYYQDVTQRNRKSEVVCANPGTSCKNINSICCPAISSVLYQFLPYLVHLVSQQDFGSFHRDTCQNKNFFAMPFCQLTENMLKENVGVCIILRWPQLCPHLIFKIAAARGGKLRPFPGLWQKFEGKHLCSHTGWTKSQGHLISIAETCS